MPKESIITVFRSTATDTPTGLTFGELAYSDLNGKLFVGKNDGTSLWVGAGVTDGSIVTNSQYLVPTQSAVKAYVDGTVGGGSVVNTVNATGGAVTITGDGGAITNVQSGKANTIVARLATTGVTGVASFNSSFFTVSSGAVSLASAYQATGDTVAAVGSATVSRSGNVATIDNRIATTGVTGVASFSSTNFDVASGAVSVKTGGISNANLANSTISGISLGSNLNTLTIGSGLGGGSYNGSGAVTITNAGVLSFNALTGAVTLTGDGGAIIGAGNNTIRARLADTSVTGVASFNSSFFTVSSGAVSLAAAYQVTGDTVVAGAGIALSSAGNAETIINTGVLSLNGLTGARTLTGDGGAIVGVGNDTIRARLASTSATGAASFSSTNFDVSGGGAVTIKNGGVPNVALVNSTISGVALGSNLNALTIGTGLGGVSYNGQTATTITNTGVLSFNAQTGAVSLTGDGGAIVGVGNNTIAARLASTSVTGAASFSTDNFAVSAGGAVTIKDGGVANAELVNSSITFSTLPISLGGSLTITGTAGEVEVSASSSTITIGLPDNVTIAGNLTVNGTVVTANVDNFTVEDPLIVLGTGNASDSVDLGFVGKYSSTTFSGLFRDASDGGRFKLFSGLTVEPTTTVNTGGAGYAMATLVARIDGGTF